MRKLNNDGFSAIEVLLIIIILAIIGGTGYYVYHANKKTSDTLDTSSSQSSGSAQKNRGTTVYLSNGSTNLVRLRLPSGWQDESQKEQNTSASCSVTTTNDLKPIAKGAASPAALANGAAPLVEYDVVKQPDALSLQDYFTKDLYQGTDAGIHSFTKMTINGNPAILYNGSGKTDGSDYKQQYYLVSHDGYVACLRWRSYDNGAAAGTTPTDYSKYSSDVQSIAKSIKFSN